MDFAHRFDGADVERVLAIWGDRAFFDDLAADLKVDTSQVEVRSSAPAPDVRQQLGFSTSGVPQPFRALIPNRLDVDWRTSWSAPDGDSATGRMRATARDGALTFEPATALRPTGGALEWTVRGDVRLGSVPRLIRSQAEKRLSDFLENVLRRQAGVTERWLHRAA